MVEALDVMRFSTAALLLPLWLGTACLGTDPTVAALGEEFELVPNQSTRIAGSALVIGFRRVVGDSRCPIDAVCVVEGTAGVELDVFGGTASGPVLVSTPLPATWDDGTYQIRLLDLLPHPTAGRAITPDEYRLRLVVDLIPR
jgi:hypothetical protein